jgi:hypothetical protein
MGIETSHCVALVRHLIIFEVNWLNHTLETMLEPMMVDVDAEPAQEWALSDDLNSTPNRASETDQTEMELTPRPRKKGNQDQRHYTVDLSADDDDEPFQTPLTLRPKKRYARAQVVMDSDDLDEELETKETQKEAMKRKREGISKKKETKVGVKIETLSLSYLCSI